MEPGYRMGHGFDIHQLTAETGGELVLGGVRLACGYRVIAHSDGDVVVHAVADALLGAGAMGDIGRYYPVNSTEPGFDSRVMLKDIAEAYEEYHFKPQNIDVTIIAQKPRLSDVTPQMAECLASDLQIRAEQVNVKATTTDKLGCIGRGEGIAVESVALIYR